MTKLIQIFLLQRQPPSAGARTGEDNPVDDEDGEENVDNDDEIGNVDDDDDDDDDDDPGDDERGQHWGVGAPWWGRALTRCSSQAQGKMSITVLSRVSTRFTNNNKNNGNLQ